MHPHDPQPIQTRPYHLVRVHRQLPDASLLRSACDVRGRVQEAAWRDARVLHGGPDAGHALVREGFEAVAVI